MLGWSDNKDTETGYSFGFDEGAETGYYKGYQDALEGKPNKYEEDKRLREEMKRQALESPIVKIEVDGIALFDLTKEKKDAKDNNTGEAAESE